MALNKLMTDKAVLAELGERLARHRIQAGLTQAELARQAGVSKRTLERLEAGNSAQMVTWVRVSRALGLLPSLDQAVPELTESPLEIASGRGKPRQRASKVQQGRTGNWTWDEN